MNIEDLGEGDVCVFQYIHGTFISQKNSKGLFDGLHIITEMGHPLILACSYDMNNSSHEYKILHYLGNNLSLIEIKQQYPEYFV